MIWGIADKRMCELELSGEKELEWKPKEIDVPETGHSRKRLADCKVWGSRIPEQCPLELVTMMSNDLKEIPWNALAGDTYGHELLTSLLWAPRCYWCRKLADWWTVRWSRLSMSPSGLAPRWSCAIISNAIIWCDSKCSRKVFN